jgi:hypothetical protein
MHNEHSELTVADARAIGIDKGYSIGWCLLAETEWTKNVFLTECSESEVHQRCFSPFEHTANEFNALTKVVWVRSRLHPGWYCGEFRIIAQDPDSMWKAYEEGVEQGALKAWREWHS